MLGWQGHRTFGHRESPLAPVALRCLSPSKSQTPLHPTLNRKRASSSSLRPGPAGSGIACRDIPKTPLGCGRTRLLQPLSERKDERTAGEVHDHELDSSPVFLVQFRKGPLEVLPTERALVIGELNYCDRGINRSKIRTPLYVDLNDGRWSNLLRGALISDLSRACCGL